MRASKMFLYINDVMISGMRYIGPTSNPTKKKKFHGGNALFAVFRCLLRENSVEFFTCRFAHVACIIIGKQTKDKLVST